MEPGINYIDAVVRLVLIIHNLMLMENSMYSIISIFIMVHVPKMDIETINVCVFIVSSMLCSSYLND